MVDVFYAHLTGQGHGCDYTIGCNERLRRLRATTLEAAVVEAVGDEWGAYEEKLVENITILRVAEEVDCAPRIAELRAVRERKKRVARFILGPLPSADDVDALLRSV